MIKVTILGSGNVAQHLISAFAESPNVEIVQVYSRSEIHLNDVESQKITNDFNALEEADLYLIAVSDNAVAEVADSLPFKNRLVAHTSGSVSLDILSDDNRKGVFYPLQTFTKGKAVDFKEIPICLETQFVADYIILEQVAKAISEKIFAINSAQRSALHVAAVFVNNFTNHLYGIGNEICEENQVPFEILKPLIRETAEKVQSLTPNEAQTGPAKRLDLRTIDKHVIFLSDFNQRNIYEMLTQSIIQNGKNV